MTFKELKNYISESYYRRTGILKKNSYYLMRLVKKKNVIVFN